MSMEIQTSRGDSWFVKVRVQELARGKVFVVDAHWKGHASRVTKQQLAHGGPVPADRYDTYWADSLSLAKAIADGARGQLNAGKAPDLRALAAELKGRDRGLVTLERDGDGARIMGDTPPDEAPR